MKWKELSETTSGAFAAITGGLGDGDPAASVYNDNKTGVKKKKKKIIKRPLNELFDSSYDYQWLHDKEAFFKINKRNKIYVKVTPTGIEEKQYELVFTISHYRDSEYESTGRNKDQYKILSTVLKIIKDFVNREKPKELVFSTDKVSKAKLYRQMAFILSKKYGFKYEENGFNDMTDGDAYTGALIFRKDKVEEKEKSITKRKRYYHASPKRFKIGTILTGPVERGKEPQFSMAFDNMVYISTRPIPHGTIADTAYVEGWNIYEVEPLDKPEEGTWDDLVVRRARVTKYIGNARGLLQKSINYSKKKNIIPQLVDKKDREDYSDQMISGKLKKTQPRLHQSIITPMDKRKEKSRQYSDYWSLKNLQREIQKARKTRDKK